MMKITKMLMTMKMLVWDSNTPINDNNIDGKSDGSYEQINEIDEHVNDSTTLVKDTELMKESNAADV